MAYAPPAPVLNEMYQIVKIWLPNHGVVTVYRTPSKGNTAQFTRSRLEGTVKLDTLFLFAEYHVQNGLLLDSTRDGYGVEKTRILAPPGTVVKLKRDRNGSKKVLPSSRQGKF